MRDALRVGNKRSEEGSSRCGDRTDGRHHWLRFVILESFTKQALFFDASIRRRGEKERFFATVTSTGGAVKVRVCGRSII